MAKIDMITNNEIEKFRLNFSRRSKPDASPLKKETDRFLVEGFLKI